MRHKQATIFSLVLVLTFFVLGPALFVFVVDPFQVYHSSFFKEARYSKEQVYQHAGWINRLLADPEKNYQGIVIGPSTMANYTQSLINDHVRWGNTLNLSVNGSTPQMQYATAKYALEKNPHVKHILWDVHFLYVFDPGDEERSNLKFPYYLYNSNVFDDYPYIFNTTNVDSGLKFLANDFSQFAEGIEDNGPFYKSLLAANEYNINGSLENRKNVLLPQIVDIDRKVPDKDFYLKQKFPSIDLYMLNVLLPLCNTDTDINITFSPTTRHLYATLGYADFLYKQILMRRYVMEHTQSCRNIRVFAFDNIDWITGNLSNYADNFHYAININNYIVESIAKNENRLTPENIDQYEARFISNLNNYKKVFLENLDKP